MGMSQNNNFTLKVVYYVFQNPKDQGRTNFLNCKSHLEVLGAGLVT